MTPSRLVAPLLVGLAVALAVPSSARAEDPATLDDVSFLVGEFSGKGKHPWGQYDESITAVRALSNSTIELRSKSTMGEQVVFEDLRVFSYDAPNKTLRMRQFSPGLLREYTGTKTESGAIVFTETAREGAANDVWRYTFTPGEKSFSYAVHARALKDGSEWKPYVSGELNAYLKDPSKGGGLGMRQYDVKIGEMRAEVHHPDGEGPFPAIVFSPGGNASTCKGYAPYGRWWATWGYVTVIVAFDDGDAPRRAPKFGQVADWIIAENGREGSPLKGMVDTTRLAAAGHSRGGFGAILASRADTRFVATLALAPSGPTEAVDGPGKARTCIIVAEKDKWLPAGKSAYATTPGERVLIEIEGMEHRLHPREQVLKLVARSTAFLEYALRGDERYAEPLTAEGAGVTIESAGRE